MAKPDMDAFMAEWNAKHGHGVMPGAMLAKHGPENYVGAALCVRGTLYFRGSATPEIREAICKCFDAYEAIAKEHLTWLWRDSPPECPDKFAYAKAPALRAIMKKMGPDDHVGFAYTGGEKPHDASPWRFFVSGLREWQAKLKWNGLDSLVFSVPRETVEENPTLFQSLFVDFAKLLKAEHGHGGFAFNLSTTRSQENEATEAVMVSKMSGLDAGRAGLIRSWHEEGIDDHVVNIGWLTAINDAMMEKVGGLATLRSELPAGWFAKYGYGSGIVIQAGPPPEIAAADLDPKPSIYVLPAMALKAVRMAPGGQLHQGSHDGEPKLTGLAANEWFTRFDVPEEDLMWYMTKLLGEPKLTKKTSLPHRL